MPVTLTILPGELAPVPFDQVIDSETNRTHVSLVDINNYTYQVAIAYMVRLKGANFESPEALAVLAAESHMSPGEFREQFERFADDPRLQRISREYAR